MLDLKLKGFTLVSCFSQNRDELLMEFNNASVSFFLRADLQPHLSCLSFPEKINRSRKNSVDLFSDVIMKKVVGVHQFLNERCFSIELDGDLKLLFKMFGNQSNVVMFKAGKATEIFKNQLVTDFEIDPGAIDRPINWTPEHFEANRHQLKETYFTFGKIFWNRLDEDDFSIADGEKQLALFQKVKLEMEQSPDFYIIEDHQKIIFSLLPFGRILERTSDPVSGLNSFYATFVAERAFNQEKSLAVRQLRDQLKSGNVYVDKNREKLKTLLADQHYQVWGDLIMANLSTIKNGDGTVTLENFYDQGKSAEIKLRTDLSPQKNAEAFYRKHKNRKIEIKRLEESIAAKEKGVAELEKQLQEIETATDLKQLRLKVDQAGLRRMNQKPEETLPFHSFEYNGFKIWVGKNAQGNDELTLRYSFKEDLWLHAKDVTGSHVLLKYQSGKKFPKDAIERAAQFAAYYSKRKNESLCPVSYTPKKFVRKKKGDPAGAVVVDREEVILVEPKR